MQPFVCIKKIILCMKRIYRNRTHPDVADLPQLIDPAHWI